MKEQPKNSGAHAVCFGIAGGCQIPRTLSAFPLLPWLWSLPIEADTIEQEWHSQNVHTRRIRHICNSTRRWWGKDETSRRTFWPGTTANNSAGISAFEHQGFPRINILKNFQGDQTKQTAIATKSLVSNNSSFTGNSASTYAHSFAQSCGCPIGGPSTTGF